MGKIIKLQPHVADLIAAGEVVERPGSVVKELIENAIDAGARSISVEIQGGGMTYIRVTDDGCGMGAEDAKSAFLRHATSKLRDEHGLEAIETLGFRGEALAAIAAVSRIQLLTRERGADAGTLVCLEGGKMTDCAPTGCPVGTTITVRDLFYNTPARLKFMKNDRAEGANVSAIVLRCGLSHPEISVKYKKDGKEEFHTPGNGQADICIYSLLGREFAGGMLAMEAADANVSVKGFVSSPVNARGNRTYQYFFVNGRYVKSKMLQAALEQAYKNCLFTGRFPACVLYISVSPASVDVNVHPAKTEVKFLREKQVFDGVYYGTVAALTKEDKPVSVSFPNVSEGIKTKTPGTIHNEDLLTDKMPTSFLQNSSDSMRKRNFINPDRRSFTTEQIGVRENNKFVSIPSTERSQKQYGSDGFKTSIPGVPEKKHFEWVENEMRTPYQTKLNLEQTKSDTPVDPVIDLGNDESAVPFHIIGEGLFTYIIVEQGENLFLIDKHAAHERMIFDRLCREKNPVMTQQLLVPVVCDIGQEETEILMENSHLLEQYGFEIDRFGMASVAIRRVPADVATGDVPPMIEELCEKFHADAGAGGDDLRDKIISTLACKAAMKAGKPSLPEELKQITQAVLSGQVKYCPHGRPVVMKITKTMLDKNFRRI